MPPINLLALALSACDWTEFGYNASGGPAGVGDAVGRAVRASMVFAVIVVLFVSLAVYGTSGHFHLSD